MSLAFTLVTAAPEIATATASAVSTMTTGAPGALATLVESTVPSAVASVLPSVATTTTPVTATTVQLPAVLEVSAAFAGALAGALYGVERKYDLVGVATLAVVTGLGGGMIRDVLLQDYGIYALENPRVLIATLVAGFLSFFFFTAAKRIGPLLLIVDAISLGLFAVIGADKALLAGLAFVPAILLGSITSVGGGMLRDVLSNEVPRVLTPGSLYAAGAVTGSIIYVLLVGWLGIVKSLALGAVIVVVGSLRLLSVRLGWTTPTPTDLTPAVVGAPKKIVRRGTRAAQRIVSALGGPEGPAEHDGPDGGGGAGSEDEHSAGDGTQR